MRDFARKGRMAAITGGLSQTRHSAGATLLVVLVGIAGTTQAGCQDGARAVGRDSPGGWSPLPEAPVGPSANFSNLAAVTRGRQVIVVAGASGAQRRVEALSLDVRTGAWRRVRAPRLRWRTGLSLVSASGGALVWGGATDRGALADGARISNGSAPRWRSLPPGPLSPRAFHAAAWAGTQMLVWGGLRDGRRLADGATFRPRSGKWQLLPSAPLRPRSHAVAVWTGREVLIWGGSATTGARSQAAHFTADGAAYDPASRRWRRLPKAPVSSTESTNGVWTGTSFVVWNGAEGAVYTPRLDTWRKLPAAPLEPRREFTVVWSAGRVFVWGGSARGCGDCFFADGAAYNPRSGGWTRLEPSTAAPRDRHAAAPLAKGFLVWGGCCDRSRFRADGALYRAP